MARWAAFAAALCASGASWAAPQVRQYSADMEVDSRGQRLTMRLYVDIGRTRTEMELPAMVPGQPATQIITIARLDQGTVYMLYPSARLYEEKALDQFDAQLAATSDMGDAGTVVGAETIDGQVCTKYEVTSKGSPVWVWMTQDQGLPVQLKPADGSATVRFRNVQPGAQPASLFEVPAGFTQGSLMQGMMQQLAPGAAAGPQGLTGGADGLTGGALEGLTEALEEMRKATGQQ